MRIAILSFGSRGDVQSYLALGLGLKHAGHTVRVVTQRECESLVREYGLDYRAVAGDVRALMQSEVGQQMINAPPNPIQFGWKAMKLIQPLLRQMMRYRAAKLGEHIRAEDGIGQALEAFQRYCRLAV